MKSIIVPIPKKEEFLEGIKKYKLHEKRDPMYKVATFLVSHFWSDPKEVTDGLGVLLLNWNQAFYRYGIFNFGLLEDCIKRNQTIISKFRKRDIYKLSSFDENEIIRLFDDFLKALRISEGKSKGKKSPVAVAKALHLLAPNFFPLWDNKIARGYKCHYSNNPSRKYFRFCRIIKKIADRVRYYSPNSRSVLKRIDEYNYSKFTKKWI